MMLPASTRSSPNFLTPRRRPSESRPLREEPPAFLWAMMNSVNLVLAGFAPERIPKISLRCRLARSNGLTGGGRLSRPLARRPAGQDLGDAHDREILTMAALALRVLASALLEGDHLRAPGLLDDLARDRDPRDRRRAELSRAVAG